MLLVVFSKYANGPWNTFGAWLKFPLFPVTMPPPPTPGRGEPIAFCGENIGGPPTLNIYGYLYVVINSDFIHYIFYNWFPLHGIFEVQAKSKPLITGSRRINSPNEKRKWTANTCLSFMLCSGGRRRRPLLTKNRKYLGQFIRRQDVIQTFLGQNRPTVWT